MNFFICDITTTALPKQWHSGNTVVPQWCPAMTQWWHSGVQHCHSTATALSQQWHSGATVVSSISSSSIKKLISSTHENQIKNTIYRCVHHFVLFDSSTMMDVFRWIFFNYYVGFAIFDKFLSYWCNSKTCTKLTSFSHVSDTSVTQLWQILCHWCDTIVALLWHNCHNSATLVSHKCHTTDIIQKCGAEFFTQWLYSINQRK